MSDDIELDELESLHVESGLATTDEFFEEVGGIYGDTRIDDMLAERFASNEQSTAMLDFALSDGQEADEPAPEWTSGTRVAFKQTLQSILTYPDIPADGVKGTVVKVRCASGKVTTENDYVFVHWDDGRFRPILAEHLTPEEGEDQKVRMVVADLGDLAGFFAPVSGANMAGGDDELVHKATKDLWSLKKDGESYVLERLFQDDGSPLKE